MLKYTNKLLVSVSLVSLLSLTVSACNEQTIHPQQPVSAPTTTSDVEPVVENIQNPSGHSVWPPAPAKDAEPVVSSDNPFAKNVMLVIDTSDSMRGSCGGEQKMEAAKAAAIEFLATVPKDAAVGLVSFGGSARLEISLALENHQNVEGAIEALSYGGGTPMANGILHGYQQLETAGRAQFGYGDYLMVVLGDGVPNKAGSTAKNLDWMVQYSPINVHTIGFCADLDVLERTGITYHAANDRDGLRKAFSAVLAEAEVASTDSF